MKVLSPSSYYARLARALERGAVQTGRVYSYIVSATCDDPVRVTVQPARSVVQGVLDTFAPCRRCRSCLRYRAWQIARRAAVEYAEAAKTWLVTLTYAPAARARFVASMAGLDSTPDRHKAMLAIANRDLTLWLKRIRKAGIEIRYFAAPELHKDGMPHWHIIVHAGCGRRDLEKHWELGFSNCRLVQDTSGIRYAAKYLAKAILGRLRCSKGYGRPSTRLGSEGDRETSTRGDACAPLSTGLSGANQHGEVSCDA